MTSRSIHAISYVRAPSFLMINDISLRVYTTFYLCTRPLMDNWVAPTFQLLCPFLMHFNELVNVDVCIYLYVYVYIHNEIIGKTKQKNKKKSINTSTKTPSKWKTPEAQNSSLWQFIWMKSHIKFLFLTGFFTQYVYGTPALPILVCSFSFLYVIYTTAYKFCYWWKWISTIWLLQVMLLLVFKSWFCAHFYGAYT